MRWFFVFMCVCFIFKSIICRRCACIVKFNIAYNISRKFKIWISLKYFRILNFILNCRKTHIYTFVIFFPRKYLWAVWLVLILWWTTELSFCFTGNTLLINSGKYPLMMLREINVFGEFSKLRNHLLVSSRLTVCMSVLSHKKTRLPFK